MADRTLIPMTPRQHAEYRRTGTIALCQCGAMKDETRPCPCPQACERPEPGEGSGVLIWSAVGAAIIGALVKVFG